MQRFWFQEGADRPDYAGYVAMARAAARLPVTAEVGENIAPLIGSMLAAGLDRNAVAWSNIPDQISGSAGQDAWAMLALASPQPGVEIGTCRISGSQDADHRANFLQTRTLLVGFLGLGRETAE